MELYQERFHLEDATFERIEHEDAMVATVYKVTEMSGRELILKICRKPSHFYREKYCLMFFEGRLPVPRIVGWVEPEKGVDGAVLMECLPGRVPKVEEVSDEVAREMGRLLAQIHEEKTVGYGDLTKREELDCYDYFNQKFEENFLECQEHLPQELMDKCRGYYVEHGLRNVDGPCIIHGDYRPGNVIVHECKLRGIIDWSSGRAGFAEEDFFALEHGQWSKHRSKKPFLEGYASVRHVPNYGAVMPLIRMNNALATIGFLARTGATEKQARYYQYNRSFLETL